MGRLQNESTACELEAEHVVGRSRLAQLRLERPYVSSQHAILRWSGTSWVVTDKSSYNGTTLDGRALQPGTAYELKRDGRLTFGHADERWVLVDDSAPTVRAVSERGDVAAVDGHVIGLPSSDEPIACIFKDTDGAWRLECGERPLLLLENGASFEVDGKRWRFYQPEAVIATRTTDVIPTSTAMALHFSVSLDEEYVEITEESRAEANGLGHRSHNYLLLTLARARLEDSDRNLPESACGWRDKLDLASALRTTPQQIDVEVFRIRKHFGQHGLESAAVVERRPRARQIRIGVARLRISRI